MVEKLFFHIFFEKDPYLNAAERYFSSTWSKKSGQKVK